MIMPQRIALIGYGEVGKIFARDLANAGVSEIRVFDIAFKNSNDLVPVPGDSAGVVRCGTSAEAIENATLVICAVTAGAALDAAATASEAIGQGTMYVDVNSVSPGTKRSIAEVIEKAGGRFVEAAIMTSIPAKGLRSATLIGGPHADEYALLMTPFEMSLTVFSSNIGDASAVKMCRSVMVKGMETLLLESLVSARYYGVEQQVLESLTDTINCDWSALARYMTSRALIHGRRRAEEVREVAKTVSEAGLTPFLSTGIAQRQDWAADHGMPSKDADLIQILDWLQSRSSVQH